MDNIAIFACLDLFIMVDNDASEKGTVKWRGDPWTNWVADDAAEKIKDALK